MRWFPGVLKILFTVVFIAVVIKTAFVYIPQIKYSFEKGRDTVPEKNSTDSRDDGVLPETGSDKAERKDTSPEAVEEKDSDNKPDLEEENSSKYFLTQGEILAMTNISLSDRIAGMAILCKLKKPDIDRMAELAEGGITLDELEQLREILEAGLCKKDIEKLYDLLQKNKRLYAEGKSGFGN